MFLVGFSWPSLYQQPYRRKEPSDSFVFALIMIWRRSTHASNWFMWKFSERNISTLSELCCLHPLIIGYTQILHVCIWICFHCVSFWVWGLCNGPQLDSDWLMRTYMRRRDLQFSRMLISFMCYDFGNKDFQATELGDYMALTVLRLFLFCHHFCIDHIHSKFVYVFA